MVDGGWFNGDGRLNRPSSRPEAQESQKGVRDNEK
jgi:hypothetical protein